MAGSLTKIDMHKICTLVDESPNNFEQFIETGTFHGETTRNMANLFDKVTTIELSKEYYEVAKKKLGRYHPVIECLHGDSALVLKDILKNINTNCVFYLDGHFSGNKKESSGRPFDTAIGFREVPLLEECKSIEDEYLPSKALIILDDYRLFNTTHGQNWEGVTRENVIKIFKKHTILVNEIINDRLILKIQKISDEIL